MRLRLPEQAVGQLRLWPAITMQVNVVIRACAYRIAFWPLTRRFAPVQGVGAWQLQPAQGEAAALPCGRVGVQPMGLLSRPPAAVLCC